jgi:signal transduction histidine kinase
MSEKVPFPPQWLQGAAMKLSLPDVLARLNEARSMIDELPQQTGADTQRVARLTETLLAARLALEEQEALRQQLAASRALADVGEVAAPVAHEFNNFLNALLLHVAVLELKMPPDQRQGLAEIRQQGKGMAALIQQWQNYRRRPAADGRTADLNEAVREAAQVLDGPRSEPLRLELAPGALPVRGTPADLNRLCAFLLLNAAAVNPPGATITVQTGKQPDKVHLRVQDDGPSLAPELLAELFDPHPVRRAGTSGLELAACKAIVRRLQGKISAENGSAGGVTVTVELPSA